MTSFDYIALAIVVASLLIGLIRGAVREVLALAAWIAAFLVANRYALELAPFLSELIESPALRLVAAFAGIFLAVFIVMALIKGAAAEAVKRMGLTGLDRALGMGVGALKGVVIVAILVLFAGMTRLPHEPGWKNAVSSHWFEALIGEITPWLPDELKRRIDFGRMRV